MSFFFSPLRVKSILQETAAAMKSFVKGNFDVRVREYSTPDLKDLSDSFNQMAATVQSQIGNLNQDKTQLSTILSNMFEAVVAVDVQGRILLINPALAKLFQIDVEASRGKPFLEILRHSRLVQLLETVLKDQTPRIDEVKTFSPTEKTFEAHAVPLMEGSRLDGALLVLHDITRLRQLEQLRKEFVANVSHELRTPLAAMKGYAETLLLGAIDDKENRVGFLKSIESQADQMTALVDDLLDLAAIESGKRTQHLESISLTALVQEVAGRLTTLASQKKVKIQIQSSENSAQVFGDRVQIQQVFTNLLDNAIKFNREGGTVDISFAQEPGWIRTQVKDAGLGIPAADLPRVFERFFRVDKARSREMGGTGLGLAIVKHIIESHGGQVSVESQEGTGSTFSFSLPIN